MVEIQPSPAEIESGALTAERLSTAKEAIERDGFVVLKDVVGKDHLALIRDRMLEEVDRVLARSDAPFNFVRSNVQQDPPPFPPYLFRDVLMNGLVVQVTHSILGDGLYNSYYSGNTALARTENRQPVHVDHGHLWPNMKQATPAYSLVVNMPLVTMDASNGSTEIWPGSHRNTYAPVQSPDIKIPPEIVEAQRKIAPPIQPRVEFGSALIRDMRLWHAGMPNPSAGHRIMIAMIHWIGWWHSNESPVFPASCRAFFEHPVLRTKASFVEGEIDHTRHNQAFDFHEPDEREGSPVRTLG